MERWRLLSLAVVVARNSKLRLFFFEGPKSAEGDYLIVIFNPNCLGYGLKIVVLFKVTVNEVDDCYCLCFHRAEVHTNLVVTAANTLLELLFVVYVDAVFFRENLRGRL